MSSNSKELDQQTAPGTIVVGLDGAHWELLDPWIADGVLPTLERIREESVWGDLNSVLPPVTCPNWKCYSTGKNPGKIGVFWWEFVDAARRRIETVDASYVDSPELWDYLNAGGYSTAVVNMPTTYPPRELDGCLVAGGPDAEMTGYTYPPSLETDLEEAYDYRVHPLDRGLLPDNKWSVTEDICDLIDERFDVALEQAAKHDFTHLTIFNINVLQHYFWRDQAVLEAWQCIDANLERVLERGGNIVLMSDHGSNEIRREFNINAWLAREGYLVLDRSVSDVFATVGVTGENARSLFGRLGSGWYSLVKALIPDIIKEQIPAEDGSVKRGGKASKVDWGASTAIASGQGPVYLLTDDDRVRRELVEDLASVEDSELGESPIDEVHLGEDVYEGEHVDIAPDIVVEQTSGWHISGTVGSETVFSEPTKWMAENKRTGMFAMAGPDFNSTEVPLSLSILDLAPTLLHLYGLPIPEEMDGTVAEQVFAEGSDPATTAPEYRTEDAHLETSGPEGEHVARDRLEDLGYL